MQSTWRTSQYPAGAVARHAGDKSQAAVPNAGLDSRHAQSPFPPWHLSTEYPQATFHRLESLSRGRTLGNLDDRQVADEAYAQETRAHWETFWPRDRLPCDPAWQPDPPSPSGSATCWHPGVCKAYQDATRALAAGASVCDGEGTHTEDAELPRGATLASALSLAQHSPDAFEDRQFARSGSGGTGARRHL